MQYALYNLGCPTLDQCIPKSMHDMLVRGTWHSDEPHTHSTHAALTVRVRSECTNPAQIYKKVTNVRAALRKHGRVTLVAPSVLLPHTRWAGLFLMCTYP
jgi:hypothetical protein